MPKTEEQLVDICENIMINFMGQATTTADRARDRRMVHAMVTAMLKELNVSLAPIVGETKR